MRKILFSTVIRPFGIESDSCTTQIQPELFHGQVTLAQGIFSIRAVYGGFGLEFIALNIDAHSVILNYPSESEFIKELQKGYEFVGITFVMCTYQKMEKMVALVRTHATESKIILGGYGTSVPGVDALADYVCREEGVGFMRRLLGQDVDAPIEHPVIPEVKKVLGYPTGAGSIILAGLGCPNGCDFCTTSHFFKRRHYPILKTGEDIWRVIQKIDAKLNTRMFGIMEEDFLLYKTRVLELAEITRQEVKRPVRLSGFSSIRAISMYDPVFLAEMGIDSLWVGIESKSSAELRAQNRDKKIDYHGNQTNISSYPKMDNIDIQGTLEALQDVGINTLVSMIIGLEHHTEPTVLEDLEYHLSLKPSLSQFLIYTAIPGTPLYDCLNKESRILHDLSWHKIDGFMANFRHPHLSSEDLQRLQMHCFEQDYEVLGASAFRFVQISLNGYRRFHDSDVPMQQALAKVHEKKCKQIYPLLDIGIKYAPNDEIVGMLQDLKEEIQEFFGPPGLKQRIMARLAKPAAAHCQKLIETGNWTIQPRLDRVEYRGKKVTNPKWRLWKMILPQPTRAKK